MLLKTKIPNQEAMIVKEPQWYCLSHSRARRAFQTFPKFINPKEDVIERQEFELDSLDAVRQHFSHDDTGSCQITFYL